jgi:hypothetical protein
MKYQNPKKVARDIAAMQFHWTMIDTILGGTEAMRNAGEAYLRRHVAESSEDYQLRLKHAVFTNVFEDTLSSVSSRPFSKEVQFDELDADLSVLMLDVDGAGSDLTEFTKEMFEAGTAYGLDFVLVDMPAVAANMSVRDFRRSGKRPYLVPVRASELLAVSSAMVNGAELFTEFRYVADYESEEHGAIECVVVLYRDPILEDQTGAITGYGPAQFEVYEKTRSGDWGIVEGGAIGIEEIPVVPFLTSSRIGRSWRVRPPMRAAAELQIYHYQVENGLDHATTQICFPVIAAIGMEEPTNPDGTKGKVTIGPGTFIFVPPAAEGVTPDLKIIETSAQPLEFVQKRLDRIEANIRELGRQPLAAGSNNITVIGAAHASQKANSAAQQWAISAQNTLVNAVRLMGVWLGKEVTPKIAIHTDFAITAASSESAMDHVDKAAENEWISPQQWGKEAKRHGVLSPDYDPYEDSELLAGDDF